MHAEHYITFLIIAKKRKRCGACEGCTSTDCGKCHYCQDKPKFGGKGVLKQCCLQRRCKRLKLLCSEGKFELQYRLTSSETIQCACKLCNKLIFLIITGFIDDTRQTVDLLSPPDKEKFEVWWHTLACINRIWNWQVVWTSTLLQLNESYTHATIWKSSIQHYITLKSRKLCTY